MAVGQNQWYHFGVGAPPILVYVSGDWDVHWGYGLLTHGHMARSIQAKEAEHCADYPWLIYHESINEHRVFFLKLGRLHFGVRNI